MNAHEKYPQALQRAQLDWSERNQQWLTQSFADLRRRIGLRLAGDAAGVKTMTPVDLDENQPLGVGERGDFEPALDTIAKMFGLSMFERDILLLAAGVELDSALRRLVGEALAQSPDSGAAAQPTLTFALQTLAEPHWDAVSPLRPLRRWRLIDFDGHLAPPRRSMQIDERVLHYLTGVPAMDVRLMGLARRDAMPVADTGSPVAQTIAQALAATDGRAALVALTQTRREIEPQREAARDGLARFGAAGLWLHARDLPGEPRDIAEAALLIDREAALSDAIVVVEIDRTSENAEVELRAVAFIAHLIGPTILLNAPEADRLSRLSQRRIARLAVPDPSPEALQAQALRDAPAHEVQALALAAALRPALQQFNLPAADLRLVAAQALAESPGESGALAQSVWRLCRASARGGLDALARRIDSRTTFDDLVAPPVVIAQLHAIAGELRHRPLVYRDWGFGAHNGRGLGAAALFAGESGTGKTFAAEAIANEARLDLYRVDLASVVSKYIGETEKNLSRLFEAAETSGAILLFDEADALFGKRSEVRDSHDRFANIEIAYLLQRIEAYRGLAILTTNMKSALDRAFLRRIRFVVQFPFPDAGAREKLWKMQFPAAAPMGDIDFGGLAKLQLTGGNIRSIALNAAFRAAARGGMIDAMAINAAVQAELSKLERPCGDLRMEI